MESVETIVQAIEAAFEGVRRGTITLHEAEVIDAYGTEAERRAARARDTEEDWRDVPDSSIAACPDALTFVDPESWRFYLPAYMRFGLRHLKERHNQALDHAIYSLAKGEDASLARYKLERFRTLSAEQAGAVRSFLELATANDAYCDAVVAKEALETYWSRAGE